MDAIVIDHLTKTHRPTWPWQQPATVLRDVSMSVERGEIFGFLGPNGAGKTTTMKIVLSLMRPTSGSVQLLGRPVQDADIHKQIGYLPESPYFYDYLTAEEFLAFYGRLGGVTKTDLQQRIPALLERVGLTEARCRPLRKFSKGMLQRIGLAQALIHDPELVILDEPMSGLDPVGRKDVRDISLSLRDQGRLREGRALALEHRVPGTARLVRGFEPERMLSATLSVRARVDDELRRSAP